MELYGTEICADDAWYPSAQPWGRSTMSAKRSIGHGPVEWQEAHSIHFTGSLYRRFSASSMGNLGAFPLVSPPPALVNVAM